MLACWLSVMQTVNSDFKDTIKMLALLAARIAALGAVFVHNRGESVCQQVQSVSCLLSLERPSFHGGPSWS